MLARVATCSFGALCYPLLSCADVGALICFPPFRVRVPEAMLEREVAILQAVDHPNIIRLEEVFDSPDSVRLGCQPLAACLGVGLDDLTSLVVEFRSSFPFLSPGVIS